MSGMRIFQNIAYLLFIDEAELAEKVGKLGIRVSLWKSDDIMQNK